MTDQRRTAADIGLPCYIDTPTGVMRWPDPASRCARHVWIAGHDALALRDKLTAAEAEVEMLRAELATEKAWGKLWYFVSDEAPTEFQEIVGTHAPRRWIAEAHKLMKAKGARTGGN